MKSIILLFLILGFSFDSGGQIIRGSSNSVNFKGSAVLADEKKVSEAQRLLERQIEADRIAEASRAEEDERKRRDTESYTIETLGLNIETLPKYYALIMGVANYKNAGVNLPNLVQPLEDARKLKDLLLTSYTFDESRIKYLADPTRSEIIHALEELADVITEKDNVLVFYAGHGVWDKQKDFGYWLPSDADPQDKSTWVPNSTLKDYLEAIRSKHTLLIADACFSGSIFKTRSVDVSNLIQKFRELYKDKSRRAMTSGNLSTVPDKSVFVEFLLKKLEDNQDVFMPSRLLFSRMFEPISNNTHIVPQFGVIQGVGDEGGDFIFIKKK